MPRWSVLVIMLPFAPPTVAQGVPLLRMDRMVETVDSFGINIQGVTLGGQRTELVRTADGFRYSVALAVTGLAETRSILTLDPNGRVVTVHQEGTFQGEAVSVDLTFTHERVIGIARTQGLNGPQEVLVDTAIAPGAIDESVIPAIVPAIPWGPDARWTIPVFSAADGVATDYVLTVTGTERIIVPLGAFDAYRADFTKAGVEGLNVGYTYWISVSEPHRLLKVAYAGQPVTIERVR